jgi:phosphatidylethanolamine-binding protein (PEBP) family uncharacterized protein
MAWLGRVLMNRRAEHKLARTSRGSDTLDLTSPDVELQGTIPITHVARRLGGQDVSPALTWAKVPEGTTQFLLVAEDPDAPAAAPFVHCVACSARR